jgi:hypothetical protein
VGIATTEMDAPTRMRVRLAITQVQRVDLAPRLGVSNSQLSAILKGRSPVPEGFEERFHAALDELEATGAAG